MKGFRFFLLLASLLDGYTCSVVSSIINQPQPLVILAQKSIAKYQLEQNLINEPFVAHNKLQTNTLEVFGTAFATEVTVENVEFLQNLTNASKFESVVFKWVYFDAKMLRILDVFNQKLQNSVKMITFEKCYFPETLIFDSSLELKYVTNCSFIHCFANEEALKQIFKIFKKAPVSSLTLSQVFDYTQRVPMGSNVDLKKFHVSSGESKILKVNELELDFFFSKLEFLSLSYCSIDLMHFNLSALINLKVVDIYCASFENDVRLKNLDAFPSGLRYIKINNPSYYNSTSLIEKACKRNVIIDNTETICFSEMSCVAALSIFSSLSFGTYSMKNGMIAINEYINRNEGVLNGVTRVTFDIDFNRQDIANMMQLLTYFPNLDSIKVAFDGECEKSQSCDEIRVLFSVLKLKNIQKLSVIFNQSSETPEFYCFNVELMKLCQNMSTLELNYSTSNLFANNIKNQIFEKKFQFPNLNTFVVRYNVWDNVDLSIDLFYSANYAIKYLAIYISFTKSDSEIKLDSKMDLDSLNALASFQVENFNFYPPSLYVSGDDIVEKLLTKLPLLSNFSCDFFPSCFYSATTTAYLQNLKNVSINSTYHKAEYNNLLTVLPSTLESLEISCNIEDMKEFESLFYEKFPCAVLLLKLIESEDDIENSYTLSTPGYE